MDLVEIVFIVAASESFPANHFIDDKINTYPHVYAATYKQLRPGIDFPFNIFFHLASDIRFLITKTIIKAAKHLLQWRSRQIIAFPDLAAERPRKWGIQKYRIR